MFRRNGRALLNRTNNASVIAEGPLLTRQCQDWPPGIRLVFWLASCHGPLQVVLENQEAVSFFPAHLKKRVENLPPLHEDRGWVEYLMSSLGPEPYRYRESPINTDFNIDKQLAPIADSILVYQQTSMSRILDRQLALF